MNCHKLLNSKHMPEAIARGHKQHGGYLPLPFWLPKDLMTECCLSSIQSSSPFKSYIRMGCWNKKLVQNCSSRFQGNIRSSEAYVFTSYLGLSATIPILSAQPSCSSHYNYHCGGCCCCGRFCGGCVCGSCGLELSLLPSQEDLGLGHSPQHLLHPQHLDALL